MSFMYLFNKFKMKEICLILKWKGGQTVISFRLSILIRKFNGISKMYKVG